MNPDEPDPHRLTEWTPATSQPGEILTPMGEVQLFGAAARGLKHRDPRGAFYRRSMVRSGLAIIGVGVAIVVIIQIVRALF
jgi:hypothetical protein